MQRPVIALENVTKRYGDVAAVADATLAIGAGEFFSLLGPSGCGKTTILRMIAGFEEPSGGRILLDGSDVSGVPPFRRNVNTVFQQYALFPHLDVFENVAFGPRARGLAEAETESRVRRMLDVVRLGGLAERRPDQLSGGQKQRVALARALVNFPRALLLDEPLSALDRKLRHEMQIELKRIQREVGIAFLFVTHDQDEALGLSDRIAVMNEGRVEQVGPPREIYGSPETVFVAGFVGSASLLAGTVERTDGERAVVRLGASIVEARTRRGGPAAGDPAIVMVRPEHVTLAAERPAGASLAATVVDVVFGGATARCILRDDAERTILANVRPDVALERGRTVYVSWAGDDAWILRPAPGGRPAAGPY